MIAPRFPSFRWEAASAIQRARSTRGPRRRLPPPSEKPRLRSRPISTSSGSGGQRSQDLKEISAPTAQRSCPRCWRSESAGSGQRGRLGPRLLAGRPRGPDPPRRGHRHRLPAEGEPAQGAAALQGRGDHRGPAPHRPHPERRSFAGRYRCRRWARPRQSCARTSSRSTGVRGNRLQRHTGLTRTA